MLGGRAGAAPRAGSRRVAADSALRSGRSEERSSAFPELDPVRGQLPAPIIAWSEWRAACLGTGADRVLIAEGFLDEGDYLRALAAHTGVALEPLTEIGRYDCPIHDEKLLSAARLGLLPLRQDGELVYVFAPGGTTARNLIQLLRRQPELRRGVRLTSTAQLQQFIIRHTGRAWGARAAEALQRDAPSLSAARVRPRLAWPWWPPLSAVTVTVGLLLPRATLIGFDVILSALFLAWMLLRLGAPLVHRPMHKQTGRVAEAELPIYTVIAALYREARSVPALVRSLKQLDWPAEKLEIKLVVEPDDLETQIAIAALNLDARFNMLVAPKEGPRTKPKALNAALPFARGTFTVIYDAEDRPEPGQLRTALDAFLRADSGLACVQAALTIDNTNDGCLARMFTAEYCAHFDVLLPCLAALRLPLPLGGSSNHFRTETLRAVCAWDPYNVTEDADLGVRLARFGYRSTTIASTTYEEAPAQVRPWLRQRTRWFKGWMQTWFVHMHSPRRLWRELGPAGFVAFQLLVGGSIVAALVLPPFVAVIFGRLALGLSADPSNFADLHIAVAIGGLIASTVATVTGLARRRLLTSAWIALLAPAHWLLLSVAAWRALIHFVRDPFRWEKTEHGFAKSSRSARPAPARTKMQNKTLPPARNRIPRRTLSRR